ncbi:Disease resistance response protein [Trema orientale]|uniref:Dirigent protein n=1 Tax=Trema orientale TaxID=63057 RepID=A0A2P5ED09_TREOI|nr:Disease resistance response protein [Trema orientale]PON90032.1 Disease resistance response protein [Trema orientale]
MAKRIVVLNMVLIIMISLAASISWGQSSSKTEDYTTLRLDAAKEKVTTLQFYFHDVVSGKTPSAVRVAQANDTDKSPTFFGALVMADDPLTETPDPKSRLVGRAQGLYGSAGQHELGLIMAMSFGFTEGEYNGSSISVLGRNAALNPVREMAVVGGTGVFRLARGYAIAQTHWFDPATGDAIVGYNVTVVH